jgi:hypothetical protein
MSRSAPYYTKLKSLIDRSFVSSVREGTGDYAEN